MTEFGEKFCKNVRGRLSVIGYCCVWKLYFLKKLRRINVFKKGQEMWIFYL